MKGNRAIVTAVVVVVVLLLGWYLFGARAARGAIDLAGAVRSGHEEAGSASFPVIEATLGNETKKAIAPARRGRARA